ncbi:MAG: hypothetical protein MMC23_001277 [Stictis urceolatum]|nr:hypothetical protein [Stictis urceolata]
MSSPDSVEIHQATSPSDIAAIRALFTAYTDSLGLDLAFQSYAEELASLPGKYAPPTGALLIARSTSSAPNTTHSASDIKLGEPLGCVALRPLAQPISAPSKATTHDCFNSLPAASSTSPSSGIVPSSHPSFLTHLRCAEIKRLYTTPSSRGLGLGKALVDAIISEARELGYDEVVLDTLPSMAAARGIYRSLGFAGIERYYETPLEGTEFLGLRL